MLHIFELIRDKSILDSRPINLSTTGRKSESLDSAVRLFEMDRTPQDPSLDNLDKLIAIMVERLGRIPEEWEVLIMINGPEHKRLQVWNSAKIGPFICQAAL